MIRVAIIGAGIGAKHLQGYLALPERFQVAAICDLDTVRAKVVAGDGDTIRIVSDLAEILADESIDLIDVCLPPHLHFPVSLLALNAGKHVVCEKPLVRSLAEADELQAAANAADRKIFPVFQYRYGRATRQLQALIDAGITGEAYAASLEVHWNRDSNYYAIPWRGTWEGESGGAVLGHAIHAHDLLCCFMGPIDEVFAFTTTRVNKIETEDCASISLKMQSGALATSSVTLGAGNDTSRLRLCFEGLTVESGSAPYTPAEDEWTFIARAPVEQAAIDEIVNSVPDDGLSGFDGFVDAIADALSGKEGREVTFIDGRRSIELVTAIYDSARRGVRVQLPLTENHKLYGSWLP